MKRANACKRMLAIILSVALCFSLVPVSVFAEPGAVNWTKVSPEEIQPTDVIAITMTKEGISWALTNTGGTKNAPVAPTVTVSGDTMTSVEKDEISWNIEQAETGMVIHPANVTDTWLYSTNANNGVRVGKNENKVWAVDPETGYLKHLGTNRYLGVYMDKPDWRAYTNTTGNTAGQTLNFWKLSDEGEVPAEVTFADLTPKTDGEWIPGGVLTLSVDTSTITDQSLVGDISYRFQIDEGEWTNLSGNQLTLPEQGAAGNHSVKIIAAMGGVDSLILEGTYTILSDTVTIAEARAMAAGTENITVEGTVVFLDGKNVMVQDATAGICLRMSEVPADIALGDVIQATGTRGTYNGLEQLNPVTTYSKIGTSDLPLQTVTIAEILADQETGNLESTRVHIENAVLGETNGRNTALTQDGSSINIYNCPTLEGISVGDTVNVDAVVGDFNGYQLRVGEGDVTGISKAALRLSYTGELKAGATLTFAVEPETAGTVYQVKVDQADWITLEGNTYTLPADAAVGEHTLLVQAVAGEDKSNILSLQWTGKDDAEGAITIKEALALENGQEAKVKGVVTLIDGQNIYVQDATGGICLRTSERLEGVSLGDTMIGTGKRAEFNGIPQLNSGTAVKSSGMKLVAKETTIDKLTSADLCTYVTLSGLKVEEVYDNNGAYTNPNVKLTDGTNKIQLYKAVIGKTDGTWDIQKGDTVNVTAAVSAFKTTIQLRNTLPTEVVKDDSQVSVETSIVESIAQWGGMTKVENKTQVFGDRYTSGDELDENAVYTVVANGKPAVPYTKGGQNDAPLYYMGGEKIGAAEGDYMQMAVSTAGWAEMTLSFRLRATKSAAAEYTLQYSTDGVTFKDFTTGAYSYKWEKWGKDENGNSTIVDSGVKEGDITNGVAKTAMNPGEYINFSFDVPKGAENADTLYIRLVPGTARCDGKDSAISGTTRFDTVELSGSPIVSNAITGYVAVTPNDNEAQAVGTELTMTSATDGAVISYRMNGGQWLTYDPENKPTLENLPCNLEVKATSEGKKDSVVLLYHYSAGTVEAVKMTPNGGSVYIPENFVEVKLSCDTEGAAIFYALSKDGTTFDEYKQYTDPIKLEKGFGKCVIRAYGEKEGFKTGTEVVRTFTERDSAQYNIYFGQLHSHTNYSDGAGSCDEAFAHADDVENLDFLAVTDHSNSFDNADSASILDGSMSQEWVEGHQLAQKYTTDDFVGLYGFEMTWSNGLGHINTFNTDGFQSRTQSEYKTYATALQNYYATLKQDTSSISQFNHPGTTFGDFSDFAHFDNEIDQLITLIEVGNGEGAIGSSGYFPSYEYYTRALDKGWHVAPSNNQDNHKGRWGDSNTARSVVLADSLTQEGIYDAMRNYRVYATEDNDLNIYYTLNDQVMGSRMDVAQGDPLTISVQLSDATDASIGKVEVIVNGGLSAASQTVASNQDTVTFNLDNSYSYYYIKVTQADGDIAVTAPVWTGEVEAVGISSFETDAVLPVQNQPMNLTLNLYNNERTPLKLEKIEFTVNDELVHTADLTNLSQVDAMSTASYSFEYTNKNIGAANVYAIVTASLNGVQKIYKEKLDLTFVTSDMVTRVVVDGTHNNDYVTGYYNGNMNNLAQIAAESQIEVKVVEDEITKEILDKCDLLIVSAPARKPDSKGNGDYQAVLYEDSFLELVKGYVEQGGSVIVTGLADYQDKGATFGAEGHTAAQQNKLLAAIGSTMTINDDEAYDPVNNGGQFYRLYPETFNTESKWTAGIVEGQTYSQYSGCTVNPGNGTWLVKGFDTTYSVDSDEDGIGNTDEIETDDDRGYHIVTPRGEAVCLAAEDTPYGGTIFAAGSVFVSDFEVKAEMDNIWDLPYANRTIAENILGSVRVELPLSTIRTARDGNLDDVFRIQGYVTAGTENKDNTFFDSIYVQDETAGIDVFPFAQSGVKVGTPIEIVGYIDEYQGDRELQVMSYKILDKEPHIYEPTKMTCEQAMDYKANGGYLIQVQGEVVSVDLTTDGLGVSQFVVKDETGKEAKVFIDGYILSGTTGKNELASIVKVGDTVSAVGLLYMHPEGSSDVSVPVLRVRDCDEIKLVSDPEKPTEPTDPSEPSVPVEPSEPTVPVDPTEPGTHTHIMTWYITKAATKDTEGQLTGSCACGHTQTKTLPKLGISGTVTVKADPQNHYHGDFADPQAVLSQVPLTDAEADAIISGEDLEVVLHAQDISKNISQEDKKLIDEAAGKKSVGFYLDITLTKQVGTGEVITIDQTPGKVKISLVVPEELRAKDASKRTYTILRCCDGKVEEIACQFDAKTNVLTFETDRSATYALAYAGAGNGGGNRPATGDQNQTALFATVMLASLAVAGYLVVDHKKRVKG